MNERIKHLAKQAGWSSFEALDERNEKFAELIVQECDRYVAERFDETEPWMCPGDLLKYFGVEK